MAKNSEYLRGRVRLKSGETARVVVVYADGRELSALVEGAPELGSSCRCAFRYDSGAVELLVNVVDTRQQGKETGAALEVNTAYSRSGREHLTGFLASVLNIEQFADDQFIDNEKGSFCLLDPGELGKRRRAALEASAVRTDDPGTERRWRERIQHVLDGRLERGTESFDASVVEVSERGVRVQVNAEALSRLDLKGDVRLNVSFPSGRLTIRAHCDCRVAWWLPPEPGEDDAMFGLEITAVHDGVHGQQWARFIAAVSQTSPVVPVGAHGRPR